MTDGRPAGVDPLRVAVFSCFFPPAFRGGGPARTLGAMTASLPAGTEAVVVARDTDLGGTSRLDVTRDAWLPHGDAQVRFMAPRSPASWWKTIQAVRRFGPDVVYVNSFFDYVFSLIPQVLVHLGIFGGARILLAPRGEFSAGALALHPARKRVGLTLFRALALHRGITWHASSANESADIRRVIGSEVNVVVRENDTDLPLEATLPPERSPGPLRMVHLSRLSPKKGLDILLAALQGVQTPLVLDIYGPAEDAAFAERCRRAIATLPRHVSATFKGAIDPASVRATLATYDVMAFPTRGENFGHVIAESLSASCPVMCPDTTPWTGFLRGGGGDVVEPDTVDGWRRAIERLAALSPEELRHRRAQAGATYESWRRKAAEQPHLFTLVRSLGLAVRTDRSQA